MSKKCRFLKIEELQIRLSIEDNQSSKLVGVFDDIIDYFC